MTTKKQTGTQNHDNTQPRSTPDTGGQWRSFDELAGDQRLVEEAQVEFPNGLRPPPSTSVTRRDFLKMMTVSLAAAGVTASCSRQPIEQMLPYAQPPIPEQIPSLPLYYATAMPLGGFANGLLVKNMMGRPIKAEGNPEHPASLGGTNVFAQGSIFTMYDPDRSQVVLNTGQNSTWEAFRDTIAPIMTAKLADQGAGLVFLTETITSPTLVDQLARMRDELGYDQMEWYQFEPIDHANVRVGAELAFGEPVDTIYDFTQADVILSLDADFVAPSFHGSVRYARDFADRRRIREEHGEEHSEAPMSRLYIIENTPSTTGVLADHRLALRASQIEMVARMIAGELGVDSGGEIDTSMLSEAQMTWIEAAVADLREREPGRTLVIAGEQQPPVVHALAHAMNDALGNVDSTVRYIEPVAGQPFNTNADGDLAGLRELVGKMSAGTVEILVIVGSNPVFTAPVDLDFGGALERVNLSIHLGVFPDETAQVCTWHIPEAYYLEAWSDARAYDGTATIMQPLILPLFGGRSAHELVALLGEQVERSGASIVRAYWENQYDGDDFEVFWQNALNDGIVPETEAPSANVSVQSGAFPGPATVATGEMDLVFRPDPTIWDGRFANNEWLQELPKTITKLVWDNAVLVSPRTAIAMLGLSVSDPENPQVSDLEHLSAANGTLVNLSHNGASLQAPIWITPGHADNAATVYLGYGREQAGSTGTGIGFNAYKLRQSDAFWFTPGLSVNATGGTYKLVSTQDHGTMEGRNHVRAGTISHFEHDPEFIQHMVHTFPDEYSLLPPFTYEENAWGMTIELNACIACGACVTACQAENNIPTVGKQQVATYRAMHWLRIDRYYEGSLNEPDTLVQPLPCMQCERAACEVVCPVNATVHNDEGLNQMIYNRCVGTRYCSNNCAYKVRHYNYLQYIDEQTPSFQLMRNPDVTVRARGVMEKCTYCVQRINAARIDAKKEGRPIADGEITPACAQACPTNAIVFGDTRNPESRVAQLKAEPHNYALLGELLFVPRTSYLGRITNPNVAISGEEMFEDHGGHGDEPEGSGEDHGGSDDHGGGEEEH
ncbi:MAG: TAT-variant-translocated molybdopterin oxidoreductase [Chloroflexaceae bacterium]|nr:TAT-variant-translocated molybdopterin oxidoreductase [Chloroflexaceae bacterium]